MSFSSDPHDMIVPGGHGHHETEGSLDDKDAIHGTVYTVSESQNIAQLAEHEHIAKNFTWYELVCLGFCENNVPAVCSLLLNAAFTNGGIPALLYGYILAYTGAGLTCLAIAELASVIPTVGGVYHMAIYLAPQRHKALAGWIVGIVNWIGWMFQCSSTVVLAAQGVIAFVQVFKQDWLPAKWVVWLVNVALYVPMFIINIWGIKWFGRMDVIVVIIQVVGIFTFLIVMLAKASPLSSAYSVFQEVRYSDPANSLGSTLLLGFFAPVTCASGLDATTHLAEEVKSPRKMVPKIMMLVVSMGAICGVVVSIMLGFIASDINVTLQSINQYPVVTLVYETLHSKAGAAIYCLIITLVAYNGSQGALLVVSRQTMALSKDGMVPASWRLHEIHPRYRLPIVALAVCAVVNIACSALYLSGSAGWNALNVACVGSFNLSYVFVVILAVMHGRKNLPADRFFKVPVLLGYFTDSIGIGYQALALVVLSYPSNLPFTVDVFNWGVVFEIGAFIAIMIAFVAYGKRHYVEVDVDTLVAVADERDARESVRDVRD